MRLSYCQIKIWLDICYTYTQWLFHPQELNIIGIKFGIIPIAHDCTVGSMLYFLLMKLVLLSMVVNVIIHNIIFLLFCSGLRD